MFPTSSRKPLLRSNSERPAMRNWPLFGFLFGLVFFFYIVYIYQAQSTELDSLKDQFDSQVQLAKNLKNELIDVKAELEKLKVDQSSLTSERDVLKTQHTDCAGALRSCSLKSEGLQAQKTKHEEFLKEKDELIEGLQKNASEVGSLRSLLTAQETISQQLNQTVVLLQNEVAALKSSTKVAAAPVVSQNNVEQPAASPTTTTPAPSSTSAALPAQAPEVVVTEAKKTETGREEEEEVLKEVGNDAKERPDDAQREAVVAEPLKEEEIKENEEAVEDAKKEAEETPKVKGGDYDDNA